MRVRLSCALIAAALWAAPSALADSSTSSNWAGYAIHHSHVTFNKVIGAWQQPKPSCTPGVGTYSAYWIGLGGYDVNSNALEQIGTEADCSMSGAARMSAWYELVPAPSRSLKLAVHAGDILAATVSVTGHRVRLELADETTHKTAVKTLIASELDLTSAEWIAEAPSECVSAQSPDAAAADFGSTDFSFAYAQSTTGHKGAISNRSWASTKITLVASGRRFVGMGGGGGGARGDAVEADQLRVGVLDRLLGRLG